MGAPHGQGWAYALARLTADAGGDDPGPFRPGTV
jgi:hypothetical protein